MSKSVENSRPDWGLVRKCLNHEEHSQIKGKFNKDILKQVGLATIAFLFVSVMAAAFGGGGTYMMIQAGVNTLPVFIIGGVFNGASVIFMVIDLTIIILGVRNVLNVQKEKKASLNQEVPKERAKDVFNHIFDFIEQGNEILNNLPVTNEEGGTQLTFNAIVKQAHDKFVELVDAEMLDLSDVAEVLDGLGDDAPAAPAAPAAEKQQSQDVIKKLIQQPQKLYAMRHEFREEDRWNAAFLVALYNELDKIPPTIKFTEEQKSQLLADIVTGIGDHILNFPKLMAFLMIKEMLVGATDLLNRINEMDDEQSENLFEELFNQIIGGNVPLSEDMWSRISAMIPDRAILSDKSIAVLKQKPLVVGKFFKHQHLFQILKTMKSEKRTEIYNIIKEHNSDEGFNLLKLYIVKADDDVCFRKMIEMISLYMNDNRLKTLIEDQTLITDDIFIAICNFLNSRKTAIDIKGLGILLMSSNRYKNLRTIQGKIRDGWKAFEVHCNFNPS